MSSTRLTLGVPDSVLIALTVLVVAALAMRLLIAGQWVRAIGTAERVAALAGVPTRRVVTGIFAYSGACAGMTAVLLVADFSAGRPGLADALLLPVITAVVVGGTATTGGVGGLLPTLVGAAVVALLRVGVSVVGAPPQYRQILYGVIILVAVALSIDRSKLPTIK